MEGSVAAFAAGERGVEPVQVELEGEFPDVVRLAISDEQKHMLRAVPVKNQLSVTGDQPAVVRCGHGKHVPVLSAFLRHMGIVTRYSQPLSQAPQHFIADETGCTQWAQYAAVYFRAVFPHVDSGLGALLREGLVMVDVVLESTITCPGCGHQKTETMPTDSYQYFYECESCHVLLKPKWYIEVFN